VGVDAASEGLVLSRGVGEGVGEPKTHPLVINNANSKPGPEPARISLTEAGIDGDTGAAERRGEAWAGAAAIGLCLGHHGPLRQCDRERARRGEGVVEVAQGGGVRQRRFSFAEECFADAHDLQATCEV
jgi:hypothetical protein